MAVLEHVQSSGKARIFPTFGHGAPSHIFCVRASHEALTQKMAAGGLTLGSFGGFGGGIATSGVTPALCDTGWALLHCSLTAARVGWGGEL